MTDIDLIIPCYNTHSTIKRVLCSIEMQTIKDKIQIILVDDNSNEGYDYLIPLFEGLNIKIVKLEKNSGPGTARRKGMMAGTSKYIMFMDSDDTLTNAFAVKRMYDFIEKGGYDVIHSNFLEELENGDFTKHVRDTIWVFGKMYSREFVEKNAIYFNDTRANEDTGFNAVCFHTGNVGYLEDNTYIWHFNPNSITRRDNGIYRFTGIEGYLQNMIWAFQEIKRIGTTKEVQQGFLCDIFIATYFILLELIRWNDKRVDYDLFIKWVQDFYKLYAKEDIDKKIFLSQSEIAVGYRQKILSIPLELTFSEYENVIKGTMKLAF